MPQPQSLCLSQWTDKDGTTLYQVMRGGMPVIPTTTDPNEAERIWRVLWKATTRGRLTRWNGDTQEETEIEVK